MATSNSSREVTKRPNGRPSIMTLDTLNKLEQAFAIGASDKEACFYADISHETLYKYQRNNPGFIERKEALKLRPILQARQKVMDDISKDVATAKWYLERKLKNEFSTKVENDTTLKLVTPILSRMAKDTKEEPKALDTGDDED